MENDDILKLFNEKFGTSVDLRMRKLEEEFNELKEAHEADPFKNDGNLSDFIDELADLNAVLFHITGIFGLTQDMLLKMAVDKVICREKDQNYKRKHPLVENRYGGIDR